jgi:hypothetical protein
MIERLRRPGGTLGSLTVGAAAILAIVGAVGLVLALVSLAGADIWADDAADNLISAVLFLLTLAGAYGLLIQDHQPMPGTVLAVVGGIAFMGFFWAIVPLVLGPAIVVLAIIRMRRLEEGSRGTQPGLG